MSVEYGDWENRENKKKQRRAPRYYNRSRIEVVVDILATIRDYVERGRSSDLERTGIAISSILYGAGVSYDQLRAHMNDLMTYGLVTKDDVSTSYKITQKGKDFLDFYSELRKLLPVIDRSYRERGNPS